MLILFNIIFLSIKIEIVIMSAKTFYDQRIVACMLEIAFCIGAIQ